MKPAPFEYVRPASVDEAIAALAEGGGDAQPLAGGQSLIPAMNFRLARPARLVDLAGLGALRGIEGTGAGGLRIGAMTRQRAVERSALVAERSPLLAAAMPWIAHPQIRNRGTIGGSLAHADPAAELPAVMIALDAELVLQGPGGVRRMPAREFYVSLFTTALGRAELLVQVELPPVAPGTRFAFEEVSRRHGDFALAGAAVAVRVAEDGTVEGAAIGLVSVGDGPVLSSAGAAALVGRRLTGESASEAADAVAAALDPPGDIHASPDYRRHLARVLTRRALERVGSADRREPRA